MPHAWDLNTVGNSWPRNKQGRQCTYKYNIDAHLCNHHYCAKAHSITHSESVSVALVI